MIKRTVLACGICFLIGSVSAQKATGLKQDEILTNQSELDSKVSEILKLQNDMKSMYGSTMNMDDQLVKMSYAYGLSLGENFKTQGVQEVDYTALNKGLMDALSRNDNPLMSTQEAQQFLNEYISAMMSEKAQKAKEMGEKWLADNAKKDGVSTTASGLQYSVIKEGKGDSPSETSKVTVHYHGTLTNGEVFDSSVERGQPATFGLNQVIKGWTEGLQLMKPGGKYKFFIPSELGYGERAPGGKIGPNEVLVFEVELLSIEG